MKSFEWSNASSIDEAQSLLEKGSCIKAGGVDLLDLMKEHLVEPKRLVNIRNIKGLDKIEEKDGVLTIKGEKKMEKEEKDKGYHLVERSYGMFARSFTVPSEVQADKVEASFDKGVLKIILPKAPEAQAKVQKIQVKSST